MKKALTVLLVALLVLCTVVSCAKKEAKVENTAAPAKEAEKVAETKVGGGELIIYSPNSDALVDAAFVFGETYGIDVQVLSMGTGEVASRVVAEAANPQADVWYGGVNFANGNTYKDYFEPYVAKGDSVLPEAYRSQNGCVTRYCLDGSAALIVNVDVLKKLGIDPDSFKGYADLLNPKLKGYIAMGDAANSSSAWAELTNMLLVMGEKPYDEAAWNWVEKFCTQLEGKILSSSSAIYKGVANGEYAVGVSYEDPCVKLLDDGATNLKLVYPAEGAVWLPAGAAVIKGCKNMDNAKLFMDWLISDAGQKEIGKTTARPVNPAITNASKNMPAFSEINVAYEDLALCGENKKAWQARFADLVQKTSK